MTAVTAMAQTALTEALYKCDNNATFSNRESRSPHRPANQINVTLSQRSLRIQWKQLRTESNWWNSQRNLSEYWMKATQFPMKATQSNSHSATHAICQSITTSPDFCIATSYTHVPRSSLFQGSPTRGLSPDFGRKRKEDVNWRKFIAGITP